MKKEHVAWILGALIVCGSASVFAYTAGKDAAYQGAMRGGIGQGERTFMTSGYRQYEDGVYDATFEHRLLVSTDTSALSDAETAGLIKMREEEKLARDVYEALADTWEVPVFENIARSEDRHTEAIESLLDAHNVDDPVTDDTRGIFKNQDLAKLYTDLVARGSASIVEAYRVGAYIEDLDINDLEKEIDATTHDDIALVYENLQNGSENHLRAFNRNLVTATGEAYNPEFISDDTFESIVESEYGFGQGGMRGGQGDGMHMGGRGMGGRW